MISFKRIQAIPLSLSPAKVLIRWQTTATDAELADYEFLVMRAVNAQDGRPNFQDMDIDGKHTTPQPQALNPQNLQPISQWIDGLEFPWHVDYSETLKNLTHESFYRVKCRNKKTQEEVVSNEFSWEGDLDLVGLYVVDEHNFLLEDVTGVPAVVFQRRRGGVKCTKCFDPIQKKRLTSSCGICYGTNWVGGFYKPIDTFVDFSPNPKATQIEAWGETQLNDCNALLSNFPNIDPGDVIREMNEGRLWRVVHVAPTEKRRCPMLQFARLTEIKPGDIEYTLPNDERFQIAKVEQLESIKKKREF